MQPSFVDIHNHILPGIDDGSPNWEVSLDMARLAVSDGISTIVATPHQLGAFSKNKGGSIRQLAKEMQELLARHQIRLKVLPGGDVRIEDGMLQQIADGNVLTLGDHGKHLLIELPHELYFPLQPVVSDLANSGITAILSHPERNQGILRSPKVVRPLVEDSRCLMQVTAGSLMGTFGKSSQEFSEWMIREGLVQLIATDAHGVKSRRPLLRRAYDRISQLAGVDTAFQLCVNNPTLVASGKPVVLQCSSPQTKRLFSFSLGKKVA